MHRLRSVCGDHYWCASKGQADTRAMLGDGDLGGRGTPSAPGCAVGHMIDALDIPVFAVHDCDVAVDPDTGTRRGACLSRGPGCRPRGQPAGDRHQIQGGVVQGLGYALHEEITLTPGGDIAQRGLESYRLPLATDSPAVVCDLYEGAPSYGPLGVKGTGEVPILNVAAAVACAVSDAIGKAAPTLPLTPPRVLRLMRA